MDKRGYMIYWTGLNAIKWFLTLCANVFFTSLIKETLLFYVSSSIQCNCNREKGGFSEINPICKEFTVISSSIAPAVKCVLQRVTKCSQLHCYLWKRAVERKPNTTDFTSAYCAEIDYSFTWRCAIQVIAIPAWQVSVYCQFKVLPFQRVLALTLTTRLVSAQLQALTRYPTYSWPRPHTHTHTLLGGHS